MDRITAETDQTITDQTAEPKGAEKAKGRRRRVSARLGAGMAAFALTSTFGVAGAHASSPEAVGSGFSQEEYLEMLEELAEQLEAIEGFEDIEDAFDEGDEDEEPLDDDSEDGDDEDPFEDDEEDHEDPFDDEDAEDPLDEDEDESDGADSGSEGDFAGPLDASVLTEVALTEDELPTGWEFEEEPQVAFDQHSDASFYKNFNLDMSAASEECNDAIEAVDDIEEDALSAVEYTAEAQGQTAYTMLVSTPEEHDFFDGYYEDVVDECGTVTEGPGIEIEYELLDGGNGVQMRYQDGDVDGYFYMAGQSFGNNHVMVIGESFEEPEDIDELLADQIDLMEEEVS